MADLGRRNSNTISSQGNAGSPPSPSVADLGRRNLNTISSQDNATLSSIPETPPALRSFASVAGGAVAVPAASILFGQQHGNQWKAPRSSARHMVPEGKLPQHGVDDGSSKLAAAQFHAQMTTNAETLKRVPLNESLETIGQLPRESPAPPSRRHQDRSVPAGALGREWLDTQHQDQSHKSKEAKQTLAAASIAQAMDISMTDNPDPMKFASNNIFGPLVSEVRAANNDTIEQGSTTTSTEYYQFDKNLMLPKSKKPKGITPVNNDFQVRKPRRVKEDQILERVRKQTKRKERPAQVLETGPDDKMTDAPSLETPKSTQVIKVAPVGMSLGDWKIPDFHRQTWNDAKAVFTTTTDGKEVKYCIGEIAPKDGQDYRVRIHLDPGRLGSAFIEIKMELSPEPNMPVVSAQEDNILFRIRFRSGDFGTPGNERTSMADFQFTQFAENHSEFKEGQAKAGPKSGVQHVWGIQFYTSCCFSDDFRGHSNGRISSYSTAAQQVFSVMSSVANPHRPALHAMMCFVNNTKQEQLTRNLFQPLEFATTRFLNYFHIGMQRRRNQS